MDVKKLSPLTSKEKVVDLKNVDPGQVFRFAMYSFDQALEQQQKDGNGFFMRIAMGAEKAGAIHMVSLDGKQLIARDDIHKVIVHPTELLIGEAEKTGTQ